MAEASAKPAEQPTYTPGPWSVDDSDPDNLKVVCDFFEDETPGVCGSHSTAWKLFPADARLIAAAPDMLAALKETTLQLQYLADKFGETGTGAQVLARVEAAIAKATGNA